MALDTQIKTQLQTYLQMLKEPVDMVASLDDSAGAKEMLALLEELAGMSDKISLSFDEHARKPSFSVKRVRRIKTRHRQWAFVLRASPWAMNSLLWSWPCCMLAVTH